MGYQPDTKLPRRCGRYILIESLGGGGMAEVYKARLAQTEGPDRVLVIKLLPPHAHPMAAARFIDEAKIALPLTHGNITATFEFGRAGAQPFLVMEYVHGRSLRQFLEALAKKGASASLSTGLFLGREIARALGYAHRFVDDLGRPKPVIHRDVSPENVLVSFAGQVKLTDFGIARSAEALDIIGAWGKPAYVAPEILRGDPGGPAADIYSLGCVIYETLAGCPPLLGQNETETLEMVQTQPPMPLHHLRDDVPQTLSDLLSLVLRKNPQDRSIDTAQLEIALSQLLAAHAPHFTETHITSSLSQLFGHSQNSDDSEDALLATRLRDQLADAGIETTGRESASEMLGYGTVELSPAPDIPAFSQDSSRPSSADSHSERQEGHQGQRAIPLPAAVALVLVAIVALSLFSYRWFLSFPGAETDASLSVVPATRDGGHALEGLSDADASSIKNKIIRADASDNTDASSTIDGTVVDSNLRKNTRPRKRRPGAVTFNSHPWSYVYVNGRKLPGHTPIRNVKLAPGRYQVRFANPELGLSKNTSVRVAPGDERFVKVRLTQSAGR